jgi:GH24 family phage-related lysozyme (muramidase)
METGMSNTAPISLEQVFRYYRGLPHQAAAIEELARDLQANGYAVAMRRDRAWFQTWSQDGKQTDLAPAIALIKEFEGCHLSAYPDPLSGGDPWTIGYGTTRYQHGGKVQRGDKITVIEADLLLRQEIDRIAATLATTVPHWKAMDDNQRSALVSFGYNLGPDFVGLAGFETITGCLRDRDWAAVPAALELYRNPGTNVEAGLLRRRRAEGKLWGNHAPQLQQEPLRGNPINAPWFSQLDSTTDQARRMCFSSSCAMLLATVKPSAITGLNADDQYLQRVQQYGDTTDPAAQVKALASYGIKARFVQSASFKTIEQQIDRGIPVPCGYLHRGPVTAPSGGGHWLCVVGYTADHMVVHDPLGESDLITGATLNTTARFARYSRKNWGPRWMVEGNGTGWAIIAD